MKPLKKNPVLLFFLCAVVTGVIEYIIGFAGIHLFGMRLWDYRELFLLFLADCFLSALFRTPITY